MNRNEFLKTLALSYFSVGILNSCIKQKNETFLQLPYKNPILKKHNKEFDIRTTRNFLSRVTCCFKEDDIQYCSKNGLEATVDFVLRDLPKPPLPINFEYENDVNTPIGKTWLYSPLSEEFNFEHYRKKSIEAWLCELIYSYNVSAIPQMMLFYHNLFPVSDLMEPKYNYVHYSMCLDYAFGNFSNLLKDVTIDASMLYYLNGSQNGKYAPNENYARELLELFTIGAGPLLKEGDYTHYTEYDVHQISKVLTGWEEYMINTTHLKGPMPSRFVFAKHDNTVVNLSEKFKNVKIPMVFSKRYAYLIDIILQQEQTAINLCKKIYRWFVHHDIDDEVTENVIFPMAACLIKNKYNVRPVLENLFQSEHFISVINTKPKIKNPIEFIYSILSKFDLNYDSQDFKTKYNFWHEVYTSSSNMGIELLKFPSVAGLKEYYQEPIFYKLWINAATLKVKRVFVQKFVYEGFQNGNVKFKIEDILKKCNGLSATEVIHKFDKLFFNKPINAERVSSLEKIILKGYSDISFKTALDNYVKGILTKSESDRLEENFKSFLFNIFSLPEFNFQ